MEKLFTATTVSHAQRIGLTRWCNILVERFPSNAHPHLDWGSASEPDEAFLSITAANDDGEVRGFFRIYSWQVDTTGVSAQNRMLN
jgi:hypothetical protein